MLKKTPLKANKEYKWKSKPLTAKSSPLKKSGRIGVRKKSESEIRANKEAIQQMWELFEKHWSIKEHICENCKDPIWGDNLTLYHDHLLEKGIEKYEHLKYEIENLFLCCWRCHTNKGNGWPGELHKAAIEAAKVKFNVTWQMKD